MKIIVCVDNQNGMMFNHRRQSQDRVLRKRILELTGGKKLWMNAYSQKQFLQVNGNMSKEQEQSGQIRRSRAAFVWTSRFWKRRGRESTVLSRTRMLFRMRAGSKK